MCTNNGIEGVNFQSEGVNLPPGNVNLLTESET